MNLGFKIVEYLRGPYGVLYTLKFEDDDKTELDRFLSDPDCKAEPEFDKLVRRLEQMVNKLGFQETFFRKQKYPVPFGYIRYERSRLRLYCWYDEYAIIVGGGGIKLPDNLIDLLHTQCFATLRGILWEKCRSTSFENVFLPIFDAAELRADKHAQ